MGRKAGIVLSSIGALFSLIGLASVIALVRIVMNPPIGEGFLGPILGIAIALLFAVTAAALSASFFGGAYLTTRGLNSKSVGALMVFGGTVWIVSIGILTAVLLPRYRGPITEEVAIVAAIAVAVLIVNLLTIVGGLRRMRSGQPF